jgi:hypothetical protein
MRYSGREGMDGHDRRRERRAEGEVALDHVPPSLTPQNVAALQRSIGNQRVAGMLSTPGDALLQRGKGREGRGKGRSGKGHDKSGGSLQDKLAALSNGLFFASHFTAAHVLRETSPDLAMQKFRPGKNTSVLFLDGEGYQLLADEVRAMTRVIARKREAAFSAGGGNPTFISRASFSYITIFDKGGQPQPGKLRHGHLVFAVEKRADLPWQGGLVPVFAINHCEAMDDTKHPDEPWEHQSELAQSDAVDLTTSDEETEDDTDEAETSESEAEESFS